MPTAEYQREYRKKNLERVRRYHREYYYRNRKETLKTEDYYATRREIQRDKSYQYYWKNRDRLLTKAREKYASKKKPKDPPEKPTENVDMVTYYYSAVKGIDV